MLVVCLLRITNQLFDHLSCCRDQWIIGRHDHLALSYFIGLIQNQCNIFILSLLSAMKSSNSKKFVSQKLKLYQILHFWTPYEIQVKIITVLFKGELQKLILYRILHSWSP